MQKLTFKNSDSLVKNAFPSKFRAPSEFAPTFFWPLVNNMSSLEPQTEKTLKQLKFNKLKLDNT